MFQAITKSAPMVANLAKASVCTGQVSNSIRAFSAAARQHLTLEYKGDKGCVALITFDQPGNMCAMNEPFMTDLLDAVHEADNNPSVGAIVLTGSEKAFASGADVNEMVTRNFADYKRSGVYTRWEHLFNLKRPLISAVNGMAAGGGFQLALNSDIILAGSRAKFCQPEVRIGVIPAFGATQTLPKLIGKSRAMQAILTAEVIDAAKAAEWGIVSSVHPPSELVAEAIKLGEKISSFSKVATTLAKESIERSYDMPFSAGIQYEKNLFYAAHGTADCKEGMTAFLEKRNPKFSDS